MGAQRVRSGWGVETQSTRLLTPLTLARGQGTKPGHTELQVPPKLVSIQRGVLGTRLVSKNGRAVTSTTPKLLPHKGTAGILVAPSGWGMGVWMMGASGQQ